MVVEYSVTEKNNECFVGSKVVSQVVVGVLPLIRCERGSLS